MEPHSREPGKPRARSPDLRTDPKSQHEHADRNEQGDAGSDDLQKILGCFASGPRLAVLAAMAHGPRDPAAVAGMLNMGAHEVAAHLRELSASGLIAPCAEGQYRLDDLVEVHESQGELHIRARTSDGMTVQGQLAMNTPTGRMLARGWAG